MTRDEFLKLCASGAIGTIAGARLGANRLDDPGGARADTSAARFPAGVTAAVVAFIQQARLDAMPAEAIAAAKRCLIDGVAVVLAGATVRGSEIVREYVKASSTSGPSTILGPERLSASPALAALANGASGHAMDYDDTQLSTTPDRVFGLLTHPTVPVMSALLAAGEPLEIDGRRFLEAFLTGFEVECKIAEAINPRHYLQGFHSTGTIGVFGAAAGVAKLLRLDAAKTAHAIGIAASLGAGIRVSFGTMTKPLHAGRAAENGVFAAELASRGFTAGGDALDGEWGFLQVTAGGADLTRIAGALGRPYSILEPGVSVKPYPSGSLGHPTMDAMLKLLVDHDVKPEQIARVRVRAGSNILNPLRYKTAKTELEAKFCLPFMMASLALRRRAGIREFTDEFVSSAPVQAMMPRVETIFDPAIEARGFDKMRSIVEVDLTDGRTYSQPSDDRYRGGPERPFTRAELHEKFADCASLVLSPDRINRAVDTLESLEQLKNISRLTEALIQP